MATIQREKIHKLVRHMECLARSLCERRSLVVHQHVDQFFYMQKVEELKVLMDQFNVVQRTIEDLSFRMHATYAMCAAQWCRDARWLNAYELKERWRSAG